MRTLARNTVAAGTLSILLVFSGWGYIRGTDGTGLHYTFRKDYGSIQYYVNEKIAPGIVNRDGKPMITSESNPLSAVAQAMGVWNAIPTASIRFQSKTPTTSLLQDSTDGKNVIIFADTDAMRSLVGSSSAVTVISYALDDYHIMDTDIVFNPAATFSTSGMAGTLDLQAILTHELGHALGENHSQLYSAAMFPTSQPIAANSPNGLIARFLSGDEIAFATALYPSAAATTGTVSGTVSFMYGGPVRYALLTLVDLSSGVTASAITGADGHYSVQLPAGSYQVYAEPFNKNVQPGNLYLSAATAVDTAFEPAFYGGNASPGTVTVNKGGVANGDIQVVAGNSALSVDYVVIGGAGATGDLASLTSLHGGIAIPSGQSVDLVMLGNGLNSSMLETTSVRVLGKGISVRPGSLRIDSSYSGQGIILLRVTIDIEPQSAATLGSVFLTKGLDSIAVSGVLTLLPPKPSFTSGSITNSASYAVSGASPGEIVSIYGTNLGPANGFNVSDFGFDPQTGTLPTTLGNVKVTFNGVPAPLFFARADVLNVQVPFEVAGQSSAAVVVSNNGLESDPVSVPVLASTPGVFTMNASGKGPGIVVNQDYTLNSAGNPAPRGSYVVVYLTGRGVAPYTVQTGKAAPAPPTMDLNGFLCSIGGVNARVAFGGWTPTAVGLAQANVMVPNEVPPGERLVVITVGGAASQPGVTMFVK